MPCASGLFCRWWSAARLSSFLNPEWVEGPKSGEASEPRRRGMLQVPLQGNAASPAAAVFALTELRRSKGEVFFTIYLKALRLMWKDMPDGGEGLV